MTPELKRIIAPAVLMALLVTTTAHAEDRNFVDDEKAVVAAGKLLADTAITAAAEEAIKAVLAATRIDLEMRFNDRTSQTTVDGP